MAGRPRMIIVSSAVAAVIFAAVGLALGAPGPLTYRGCVTGETASGTIGGCAEIPTSSVGGNDSGLDGPESIALSADGESLYLAAANDSAVARFKRAPRSGKLTYRDCITGDSDVGPGGSGACAETPHAAVGGQDSGLDDLRLMALSRDGRSLYVTSADDDSVASFKRNPRTGKLRFQDCITGETESDPACRTIPHATSGGASSGLYSPKSLVLSRDGKWLYTASTDDAALGRFKRNTGSGKLTYRGCITGDTDVGPGGTGACKQIPAATAGGADSGLDDLRFLALSPNGKSLYSASNNDAAVARFKRAPRSGKLTYQGCLSGETETGPGGSGACRLTSVATSTGNDSGMVDLRMVAVSGDGKSLYTTSRNDTAVARFQRNTHTGRLIYKGCLTAETETGPGGSGACAQIPGASSDGEDTGFDSMESIVPSPDGKSVYTAAANDDAVDRFKRDPGSGKLTFKSCITGETESGPSGSGACDEIANGTSFGADSGLDFLQILVISADGKWLYTAAKGDDAVARFKRQQ